MIISVMIVLFGMIFCVNLVEANSAPLQVSLSLPTTLGIHFVVGILIEILVGSLLLHRFGTRRMPAILLANIISYPIFAFVVYFIFNGPRETFGFPYGVLIFGELFVVVLEAVIIFLFLKKQLSFLKSFLLSFLLNTCSLVGGFFAAGAVYSLIFSNLFTSHLGY